MEIDGIRGVVSKMKLHEKTELACGENITAELKKADIPSVKLCDELLPYSASEPSELAVGCTFSEEIAAAVSKCRAYTATKSRSAFAGTVGCGLITNPMRIDACGFFSEDPFLTARLLKSYSSAGAVGYVFTDALGQGRYNVRTIDNRALHELYLYPLSAAGKHASGVMFDGGYLNGQKISSSRTVSDMYTKYVSKHAMLFSYCSDSDALGAANCGAYRLGAEDKQLIRAIERSEISESKIDRIAERTLYTVIKTCELYDDLNIEQPKSVNIAYDSTVLLKSDATLPTKIKDITFFGDESCFDDGDEFGVLPIADALGKLGKLNVFLVTDYANGIDPSESEVIISASKKARTVLVLCGGAAADFVSVGESVNAVLYCPYCPKLSDLYTMLTEVSPRGHLPFSWCKSEDDYPRNNKKFLSRGDFRYESVYNGYMLFNNFKSNVLYPFGHGLCYTSYEVSKFSASGKDKFTVDFCIKNTGKYNGVALVQVYATLVTGGVYGLSRRLVAFKRIPLEKGESSHETVEFDLAPLKVYDENNHSFVSVGGKYKIELGFSSTDIRASGEIKVNCPRAEVGLSKDAAPSYYNLGGEFAPTAPEIEKLLKVPFITKQKTPETIMPSPSEVKPILKRIQKTTPTRLFPRVRYKIENTPT